MTSHIASSGRLLFLSVSKSIDDNARLHSVATGCRVFVLFLIKLSDMLLFSRHGGTLRYRRPPPPVAKDFCGNAVPPQTTAVTALVIGNERHKML